MKPRGMAVAVEAGRVCAEGGGSISDCPYQGAWQSAWVRGFAEAQQLNLWGK